VSILGTDISTRVLKKAERGLYPETALAALTPRMRKSCLLKGTGKYQGQCLVKPEVRALIDFQQFNLLEDCSSVGPFQVIFCRNMMIYFDLPTQQTVVDNLVSRLVPGGYLLIGHAESLNGIKHSLKSVCSATFQKPGSGQGATGTPGMRQPR
jgi:chemotaxis protein methyltransferase CheR